MKKFTLKPVRFIFSTRVSIKIKNYAVFSIEVVLNIYIYATVTQDILSKFAAFYYMSVTHNK